MADLTLLLLADMHFAAESEPEVRELRRDLAGELVERAVLDANREGGFDALVLLGDMTDSGYPADLGAIEEIVHAAAPDVPRITTAGNHDRDPDLTLSIFSDRPGVHEVKGCRIYTFLDRWDENDVCMRPTEALHRFSEVVRAPTDEPLAVVQHNPIHPPIVSDYPYIPPNRDAIMSAYAQAGVLLSLSGHYHPGQPLCESDGVLYYTCPALSASPFRYALVKLQGREVSVAERQLLLPASPPIFDMHAHTHYAYCGQGVTAPEQVERARTFGLAGLCLTEHADQLYLTGQEYRAGYVYDHPDFWCAPRSEESERMPRYRLEVAPLRSESIRLGLEVELDAAGRVSLREEHSDGWDLLIGAVHWMPGGQEGLSLREAKRLFMRDTERILEWGVDVLAHPFRFFLRRHLEVPGDLYRPVAQLLAGHNVAAEINFHTNEPDPDFFAMCIEEGAKIAFGSDAHEPREGGDFHAHLCILRQAAGREDVDDLTFHGPWP